MIFGKVDLVVPGPTSADDWWVLMFEIRQRWPEAIFHRADAGEMSVYRDREVFRRGVAGKAREGFIFVRMGPESLTLTVNEEESEVLRMGHELVEELQRLRKKSQV